MPHQAFSKQLPSSYYDATSKVNPVIAAFEQEYKEYRKFATRRVQERDAGVSQDDVYARGSNKLFKLWKSYSLRLPKEYFIEKLMELGDFLCELKEYEVALHQCYERFFDFTNINLNSEHFLTFETLLGTGCFSSTVADSPIIRALVGASACRFRLAVMHDPLIQSEHSLSMLKTQLARLRTVSQLCLPVEKLCWLTYNITVHIYNICRYIMVYGHSNVALEFLLWSSCCLEGSIPLLSIRYLAWRSVIYVAVCQCYLDLKDLTHAESFAKRALVKIEELNELEKCSATKNDVTTVPIFRSATIRIGSVIFLKQIYDYKKRQRLMPNRPNKNKSLKDIANNSWPRTGTEKMLNEVFEGSAAQFLTILEVLNDPNKRIAFTSNPSSETDDIWTEVYTELFFAGAEIVAGGGGIAKENCSHSGVNNIVKTNQSLMQLASNGVDGVTVESAIKFIKIAYCFEQWDSIIAMLEPMIHLLQSGAEHVLNFAHEAQSLRVLAGLEQLHPNARKHRRFLQLQSESQATIEREGGDMPSTYQLNKQAAASKKPDTLEDWLEFSAILLRCLDYPKGSLDTDIIVDGCLYLWNKCRTAFSKIQTGSTDVGTYIKALQKVDQPQKMLQLLCEVQKVMSWIRMSRIDPLTMGDATLKLAYTLELAGSRSNALLKPWHMKTWSSVSILEYAVESVGEGLIDIATYKDVSLSPNQWRALADMTWKKNVEEEAPSKADSLHIRSNTVNDVHCELLFLYHRVCIRLAHNYKVRQEKMLKDVVYKTKSVELLSEKELIDQFEQKARTNPFSTVMFLLARAYMLHIGNLNPHKIASVVEEALFLLDRIKEEEEDIYTKNLTQRPNQKCSKAIPPAPFLLKRSGTYMILQPAAFQPSSGDTVCWYRIFAKQITGPDSKVRFNDNLLTGTGVEVPAEQAQEFTVSNLIPGEKYVFAFAAYTKDGTLIGNHIGESTKPIVAYQPLPVLTAYGFLAQVSCITSQYRVAQQAFKHLWNHLVLPLPTPDLSVYTVSCQDNDLKINLYKVDIPTVNRSSPVFQRLFLINLFTSVDVAIRDGALYSNMICDRGPPFNQQVKRLRECEKLLVAIELSGMLNDAPLAFQAIVLSYGLIVPMIHNKLPSIPVVQILLRVHAVLTELPATLRVRRQQSLTDCISHMIACITYHTARLLRIWRQKPLAREINSTGRKLLTNVDKAVAQIHQSETPRSAGGDGSMTGSGSHRGGEEEGGEEEADQDNLTAEAKEEGDQGESGATGGDDVDESGGGAGNQSANIMPPTAEGGASAAAGEDAGPAAATAGKDTVKQLLVNQVGRKGAPGGAGKSKKREADQSDELRALQANMLRLSRNIHPSDELYGTEDPIVLHAYVASLPAKAAYREISKFKKKPSFIQFLVQVVSKSITEGRAYEALDWCDDAFSWLTRRQDQLNPVKTKGSRGNAAPIPPVFLSTDENKKYGATVSEIQPGIAAARAADSENSVVETGLAKPSMDATSTFQVPETVGPPPPSGTVVSNVDRTKAELAAEAKGRARRKNKLLGYYKKFCPNMTDAERALRLDEDEAALAKIEANMPIIFKTHQRKRRLRKVSFEEYPWRSQLNSLHGVCIFSSLLRKLTAVKAFDSVDTTAKISFLDIDFFTLDMAGRIVVGWPGVSVENPAGEEVTTDADSAQSAVLFLASRLVIGEIDANEKDFVLGAHQLQSVNEVPLSTGPRFSVDLNTQGQSGEDRPETPRTYRSDDSDNLVTGPVPPPKPEKTNAEIFHEERPLGTTTAAGGIKGKRGKKATAAMAGLSEKLSSKQVKADLANIFNAFSRSVNLAERGSLWILTQNNIKMLWNIYQCLYALVTSSKPTSILTIETLRNCSANAFLQVSLALHSICVSMQLQLDQMFTKEKKRVFVAEQTVFGTQEDEVGGSNLNFEKIADDITLFDAKFAYRVFLRTLELLFFTQRWESLADLAFKINAITNCRFIEQVSPFLIYSQHKIIERIVAHNGPVIPQPSFAQSCREAAYGERYDAPTFNIVIPLTQEALESVNKQSRFVATVPPPPVERSLQVSSVPLDIDESVAELSRAMDQSQFVSHGLRHARRLLALYMAGHHLGGAKDLVGDNVRSDSQVRVNRVPVYIPTPVPQDMKTLRFNHIEEVQFAAIPAHQLSTVIKAYQHASDLLSAKKEVGGQVQALHELGNLYLHQENYREANRVWCQAIDILFKSNDVISDWRKVTKSRFGDKEVSQVILDKCGIWGSLMAGVLVAKIARYITKFKVDPKLDLCVFASACFKVVFRASLPYPQSDIDYASYTVGPDPSTALGTKTMEKLFPGLDIFSDKFRCNARTLVSCLLWVTNEMHRSHYNLMGLPTMAFCEYICAHVCRDLTRTVLTRLTKIRLLTVLQLYSPACDLMLKVLFGVDLPQKESVVGWRSVEGTVPNLHFNQSRPIFDSGNLKVIEVLAEKRLSSALAQLYGPALTCQVSMVQSLLRIAIAASFSAIPTDTTKLQATDFGVGPDEDSRKPKKKIRRVGGRTVEQLLDSVDNEKFKEDDGNSDVEAEVTGVTRVLTSPNSKPSFSLVCGLLLDSAFQDLSAIYSTLRTTSVEELSPSELEFLIESLVGLGRMYAAKQQRTEQAQHLMQALNALKVHPLFNNSCKPSYNTDNFWDVDARVRLDMKLWMNIRLELTSALLEEIREMGAIGGNVWINEVGDCRMHCAEGVMETEKYEDHNLTAQYLYLATLLDIKQGKPVPNILQNLLDSISAIESGKITSVYQFRLYIIAKVTYGDLLALDWFQKPGSENFVDNELMAQRVYQTYLDALQSAVQLGFNYGEVMEKRIEDDAYSTIEAPLKNLFSTTYLPLLAHIKLRLGHCLCRKSVYYDTARETNLKIATLKKAVGLFSTALSIARAMSLQQPDLEAEILFQKGRAYRQLFLLGLMDARVAAIPLREAIITSWNFNHDLGLMRQAYLEMAMMFMGSLGTPGVPLPPGIECKTPENPLYKEIREPTTEKKDRDSKKDPSPPAKKKSTKKQPKKTAAELKREKEEKELQREIDLTRKAAWGCIKGAAIIAQAQQSLFMLPAEEEVLKFPITEAQKGKIPAFCMDDLAKSHGYRDVDIRNPGKTRGEMTSMELIYGEKIPDPPPSIESFISWVHVLGYADIVERLGGMLSFCRPSNIAPIETSSHISEATFAYYEHPLIEVGLQQTFLRTPVFGVNMNLRSSALHEFLKNNLPSYANSCCAPYPPEFLNPPPRTEMEPLQVFEHNYDNQRQIPEQASLSVHTTDKAKTVPVLQPPTGPSAPGASPTTTTSVTQTLTEKGSDVQLVDGELAVQWYISPLDGFNQNCMLLMYSMTKKLSASKAKEKEDGFDICAGVISISISSLMNLHDMLMTLLQRADVQLAAVEKIPTRRHRPVRTRKLKKDQDLKKDEKLEDLFKHCLHLVLQMFQEIDDGLTRSDQIPTLSTKVTEVRLIEQTFNLSSGSLIKSSDFGRWVSKLLIPPPANAVSPTLMENILEPPPSRLK